MAPTTKNFRQKLDGLLLCFCKPVIGPWALRENNALQFSHNNFFSQSGCALYRLKIKSHIKNKLNIQYTFLLFICIFFSFQIIFPECMCSWVLHSSTECSVNSLPSHFTCKAHHCFVYC